MPSHDFQLHHRHYPSTTKKRYNDTAIHGAGAGAGAGALHKLCKLLPSITTGDISNNIFRGEGGIPKNISYKAPLHQMIACPCLID